MLQADREYRFTADGISGTLDDVAIRVYNSSGTPVTSLADASQPQIDYTPSSPGTYFLAISAGGNGDWQSKTGNYNVALEDRGVVTNDSILPLY